MVCVKRKIRAKVGFFRNYREKSDKKSEKTMHVWEETKDSTCILVALPRFYDWEYATEIVPS